MGKKRNGINALSPNVLIIIGTVIVLIVLAMIYTSEKSNKPLGKKENSITIPWIPTTVKRWEKPIVDMSKKYDIDPNLVAIIMTIESGGYTKALSEADAKGLMQITPPTAQDISQKFLKKSTKKYKLDDPFTNIEFGTAYLAYLRDEFGTEQQGPSWDYTAELVAAGYNGGPGAANKLEQGKGLTDTQTVVYSRDVLNMWRERNADTSPTFDRWKERGGDELLEQAKNN